MKALKKGDKIVPFTVKDIFGNPISTADYKGKKLMISFYRYSECMLCNLRINQLIKRYEKWQEQNFYILAFSQSPRKDILKYTEKREAPFPFIADPKRKIYQTYQVNENSTMGFVKGATKIHKLAHAFLKGYPLKFGHGSKTLIPADFLIDENQKIYQAYYGKDISDHIPTEVIERFLDRW